MEEVWGVFFTLGGEKEERDWCDSVITTNVWITYRLRCY